MVNTIMKASEFMSDHAKWVEQADAFVWKNAKAKKSKEEPPNDQKETDKKEDNDDVIDADFEMVDEKKK